MPGVFSQNDNLPQKRQGYIATAIVSILFIGLIGRLYYFQVLEGAKYQSDSERNSIRTVTLEAPRGLIFDRHGVPLAENRASYTIAAIPIEISDATIARLGDLIDQDPAELREKIRDRSLNSFKPVHLQRDASFEIVSRVEEHLIELPGVTVQFEPTRLYPMDTIGSHLLGYVAEVSKAQLERLQSEGYQAGDLIGKSGIEKVYERFLRGKNGVKYIEVNVRGQEIGPLEGVAPIMPVPGQNVYLTIDARVQLAAEHAIQDTMAAALVALDPNNGEVLAFVSKPNYNPNLFPIGISPGDWKAINEHPKNPLLNRVTRGQYPAASTMKIVTGAAGIEEHLVDGAERYQPFQPCTGGFWIGRRYAKCWYSGHGTLDLNGAITNSCDVYFYQLGLRIGLDRWAYYARMFGLGTPVGIDLGDELSGLIPDMSYFQSGEDRIWTRGKMLNLAIGQGEALVTPIQMAVLTAVMANGGTIHTPFLMRSVESPQGDTIVQGMPSVRDSLRLRPKTIAAIQKAMISVVNIGTGRRARIKDIQVAGKTGTAENPHGEDHSWFVGYAPADHPTIAVALILENAPHGAAVPVVRRVIEAYLIQDQDTSLAASMLRPATR